MRSGEEVHKKNQNEKLNEDAHTLYNARFSLSSKTLKTDIPLLFSANNPRTHPSQSHCFEVETKVRIKA